MSAVPEKVLNWLYSVLTSEYTDVNRTYSDVAQALSAYPSLSPRTEVYTFENGSSALLLLISGTIPAQFRGTTYRFPIALWIPHAYPRESPIVYVTPASGMLVRPGQHVASDGRVYHPYLAGWAKYWDKSSISDFLQVLRGVFAKEPPVVASQQIQPQPPQEAKPPPVPPPPDEWRRSQQPHVVVGRGETDIAGPPPVPPKPGESPRPQPPTVNGRPSLPQHAPPLPPLPPLQTDNSNLRTPGIQGPGPITPPQPSAKFPSRQSTLGSEPSPFSPNQLPQIQRISGGAAASPVSPVSPDNMHQRSVSRYDQPPPLPPQQPQYQQRPPYPQYAGPPPIQGNPPAYYQPQQQHPRPQVVAAPPVRKAAQPAIDLLSSPLDVTLPSQTGDQAQLPVPPVPPNPEKDALLHALSQTIVGQTRQILDSNNAAIPQLIAQNNALRSAHAVLSQELEQLQHLDTAIDANEKLLRDAMAQADGVIRDAAGRQRPNIDDVSVPPFVAHKQLYDVVAEIAACEDARTALGKGLDRGRIPVEVWVRQMRAVGREEFLKKALVRKLGAGLGLDQGQRWTE